MLLSFDLQYNETLSNKYHNLSYLKSSCPVFSEAKSAINAILKTLRKL